MESTPNNTHDVMGVYHPSETAAQCKVCQSVDRFEIEVALAQGHSLELTARRFSRGGQSFSRQNLFTHRNRHMQVVDQAVVREAAARMRNRMLDVTTAGVIDEVNSRNRQLMRDQLAAVIENNELRWTAKEAMAYMEYDERVSDDRSAKQLEAVMIEGHVFADAVMKVVPRSDWKKIHDAFEAI
jgi:hypothetical protein